MEKKHIVGIVLAVIAILGIILGKSVVGYKDATELLVSQSPFGNMSCVEGQGFYLKGFANIYKYDKTKSFYFNSSTEKVKGQGWEGDETDEDDISVTLSRNANADISGYMMYELPTNCDDLIKLHIAQHSESQVKHNLVRNAVLSAVRKTAPLFTAEEAKVTKIAEFRLLAFDQLTEGEYLTTIDVLKEKAGEDEVDSSGKVIKKAEVQEYRITKLKLDTLGNRIITKQSALNLYGIKVLQFEIQNVKLDPKAQQQLDIVKEREMQRVANATAAETAKQKAVTAKAEGDARIAQAKADQEVAKIAAVVQAEKERDVAVKNAERERDVAKLNAERAKFQADSTKQAGIAQAEANRAKVAAGLTPQERAEWEYKTKVGIAQAIATSPQKWVPDNMVVVGDGHGNGKVNPLDAVGLKMLNDLVGNMNSNK